jgi:hypothetical protein
MYIVWVYVPAVKKTLLLAEGGWTFKRELAVPLEREQASDFVKDQRKNYPNGILGVWDLEKKGLKDVL